MTQDQCVDLVSTSQKAADEINLQMRTIAETLPEYKVLRSMAGVGDRLGPVILGEIGDVRRFHSGKALNAYAGAQTYKTSGRPCIPFSSQKRRGR